MAEVWVGDELLQSVMTGTGMDSFDHYKPAVTSSEEYSFIKAFWRLGG